MTGAFAPIRRRMEDAGYICAATGRLTEAGLAYSEQVKRDVRDATPPPEGVGHVVRWNVVRGRRS